MLGLNSSNETTELIKSLDENSIDLTSVVDTVRVLDKLKLPLFEHILVNQICKDLNIISPEINNDQEDAKIFRKIFFKVKELRQRNPEWKLKHAPKKSTYFRKKMTEEKRRFFTQEEARELVKFEKEKETINRIDIEKNFEENEHLFKLIKESRFTRIGRRSWLSVYKFPDLHKLTIYDEHNFLCEVEGTRDKKYRRLRWSTAL